MCIRSAQIVADGVFYAELNELLTRELAEHGYSGVEVRVTPMRTEIIIRATRTQNVLGEGPSTRLELHDWDLQAASLMLCSILRREGPEDQRADVRRAEKV